MNSGDLADAGKELRGYAYCTDGRGRVSLESGCLIFDEGSNLTEITDYYAQQYTERFESFSTRKDRVEFNENMRSVNKYFATHGMFSRMNMVLDDYYQSFRSNPLKPSEVCPAEDDNTLRTSEQQERCDTATAAYQQAFFYLDLLKTPTKTCNVNLLQTEYVNGAPKTPVPFLNEKMDLSLVNIYGGLIAGDEYTGQLRVPTSCFDPKLTEALSQGPFEFTGSNGNRYELTLNVTAESKHGEFLNKVQLAKRPSTDNAPRIGYEVEHLGNWMDKVLALEYLLTPSSLRGIDFALIDLPGVREELNILIDHWNISTPIPLPSDITSSFSNVVNPYEMVDADGKTMAIAWNPNWKTEEIRSTPSFLSWWFGNRYGLHTSGGTPFAKAMNQVLVRYDSHRTDSYKPEAFAMRSKVSVYDYDGHVPAGYELIEIQGEPIVVDARTDSLALGKTMLNQYKKSDAYMMTTFDVSQIAGVHETRVNAEQTAASGSERSNDLLSSEAVKNIVDKGPGTATFLRVLDRNLVLDAENPDLTGQELFNTVVMLFGTGDVTVDTVERCYTLQGFGCLFFFDSTFNRAFIQASAAFKALRLSDQDLANETLLYLDRYAAAVASVPAEQQALLNTPKATLKEYFENPLGREALKLKALDETGFRNLVILDERENISRF